MLLTVFFYSVFSLLYLFFNIFLQILKIYRDEIKYRRKFQLKNETEEFWIIFNGFIVLAVIALTEIVGDVCERNAKFLEVWPF